MNDRQEIENIAISRAVQTDPNIKLIAKFLYKLGDPSQPQKDTPIIYVKQAYTLAKDQTQRKVFLELMALLED